MSSLAGITTLAAANTYLTERFIPDYNAEFAHPPADPTTAFVPCMAWSSTPSSVSRPTAPSARTTS
jgi:hypothetical protein